MKRKIGVMLAAVLMAGIVLLPEASAAPTANQGKKGLFGVGAAAPDFKLTDVTSGAEVTRDQAAGEKGLMVMFICRHCPFVQHVKSVIGDIAREYRPKGIGIVAISANDPAEFKADSPESLKEMAAEEGYEFPFLFDADQSVAKAYTAVMTPDIFLFDPSMKLVYRGQIDGTRPGKDEKPTGVDLRAALDNLLEGKEPLAKQKPAIGCSIKWKAGNEPSYA